MINSMTGFGHSEFVVNGVKFIVTIKSVNSKYFDINTNLPNEFYHSEDQLIKMVKSMFSRGKFDIYVTLDKTTLTSKIVLNEFLLKEYLDITERIKKKYKFNGDLNLNNILNLNGVLAIKQNKEGFILENSFKKGFLETLKKLKKMREIEGKMLFKSLNNILDNIDSSLKQIKKHVPDIIENYKNRLTKRVNELLESKKYDENRILMEVAIMSDKIDINEEIQRLNSHIIQMKKTLLSNIPVGKTMEFLLQEMLREINTMGSKVIQVEVTKQVIAMKEAIEQLREQARNIE